MYYSKLFTDVLSLYNAPHSIDASGNVVLPPNMITYHVMSLLGVSIPHPECSLVYTHFEPEPYQRETVQFMTTYHRSWILNDMGTGKTACALWASNLLRRDGLVRKVLIVCPLSTAEVTWKDHIMKLSLAPTYVGTGDSARRKAEHINSNNYTYIVLNHDALRSDLVEEAVINWNPELVIYDEATAVKNTYAQRSKAFTRVVKETGCMLWAMTGTPQPNGPSDIYTVQKLITPDNMPNTLKAWEHMTMIPVGSFKKVPVPSIEEIMKSKMGPAILFKRGDLPSFGTPVKREVQLTKEQQTVFSEMKRTMIATVRDAGSIEAVVVAVNAAVQVSKLLQICAGNVYDNDSKSIALKNENRLNELCDVLIEAGVQQENKAVVFSPWVSTFAPIQGAMDKIGITSAVINGNVKESDRTKIITDFQETEDVRVLLCHPRTTAHGITLTKANIVIWYAPIYSLEYYLQANARVRRIGQGKEIFIVHIGAHPVEWGVYDALERKENNQQIIIDLYEQIVT